MKKVGGISRYEVDVPTGFQMNSTFGGLIGGVAGGFAATEIGESEMD